MNARQQRGQAICEMQDQIERMDDSRYFVRSQSSSDRNYEVLSTERGWSCSCPDHQFRHVCCKHIHAVEISRKMHEAVRKEVVIRTIDLGKCKHCDSANIVKDSIRRLKKGNVQQLKCKDCGKRFIHNLGFEKKQASPEQISTAVELVFSGLSTRKTAQALQGMNVKASHMTVMRWASEYATLMEKFAGKITPNVGESWRTDEVYMKIRGNKKYLFAMLDSETRFWIAKMVATHKGNDDVAPMFKDAKKTAGKIPETLISDGASKFHHAWKNQYKAKNFLHKETEHVNEVAFDGIHHNNQMESFNGNTIRHREKVARGLKKEDSAILTGLQLYHNYVRKHQSLNGKTPGEIAGIHIEGNNKFQTLIQAAAKAATASG